MSYNPGVSDISGQIIARGVSGMVAQHADALLKMQENEQKRRAAAGQIQGLLASDPQLASKADPTLVQKLSLGKANLADTMQLLGTLSAVRSSENDALNAKLSQAKIDQALQQGEAHRQQAEHYRAQLESQRRDTAAIGTALNGPYAQPADFSNPEEVINRVARNGGSPQAISDLALTAERLAQSRQRGAPQGMMFPNAQALEAKYPADKYDYQMQEDPRTGAVSVPKVSPRAPAAAAPNQFGAALDEGLGKQVSSLIEKVPDYTSTLEQVQRARAALAADPGVGGGKALESFKLGVAQTINGLAGSQVFNTAATELKRTSFSDMALTAASRMKNQGQITEPERQLLAQTVAQLGDSPETINYVMNYMEAAAQRNLAKAQAANKLRSAGNRDAGAYSSILTNWETENPIDLEKIGGVPAKAKTPAKAAPKSGPALPPGWSIRN